MNATISLSGILLKAINLPLQDKQLWFDWYYERNIDFIAEANADSGHAVIALSIENLTGTGEANASIFSEPLLVNNSNLEIAADGNADSGDIVAITEIQDISGEGSAFVATNGSEISSEFGSISGLGGGVHLIDGLELQSVAGEVTASEAVNGDISLSGIELSITQGNVSASAVSAEILQLSGNPRRYSANQFKNAKIALSGIRAKITSSKLNALGVVSINGVVSLQSVGTYLEVPTISAEGILSISDEEIALLLMAA